MQLPNNVKLATSNISDKEKITKKPTEKSSKTIGKNTTFSNLFKLGKEGKEKKEVGELVAEKKNSKVTKKTEEKGVAIGAVPAFVMQKNPESTKEKTVEKVDFGNRIMSSKMNGLEVLTAKEKSKDIKVDKSFNPEGKISLEGFEPVKKREKLPEVKDIEKLYELKEKKAVENGLKVKDIAKDKEIVVVKGTSPQSKGRVYLKEDFQLNNPKTLEGASISESDLRKVNQDLTMVTKASYGLKKFNNNKDERSFDELLSINNGQKAINNNFIASKVENVVDPNMNKLDFFNVLEQVENGIKVHFNSQLKEMKIRLQPEELGEVEVKLKIDNNIMKAEFLVESQRVKEVLEGKFDTLKNSLLSKGIDASEINVFISNENRSDKGEKHFAFEKKEKMKVDRKPANTREKIEILDKQSVRNRRIDNSSFDIFV